MREIQCFDREDCYFAAFIIPVVLMIISIILFVLGKRFYKIKEPKGECFLYGDYKPLYFQLLILCDWPFLIL